MCTFSEKYYFSVNDVVPTIYMYFFLAFKKMYINNFISKLLAKHNILQT